MPSTTLRFRSLLGASALFSVLSSFALARAEVPFDAAPLRPIRIEGYWNRDRQAPGVLEGIHITSSAGGPQRIFGITALQAYKPPEEGVQVLRHSELQPSLRLLGGEDLVRRFINAPETQKVVAYGVYRPASSTLVLNSVEVGHGG